MSTGSAFEQHWLDDFGGVYAREPVAELSWFAGSAGAELYRLVVDQVIRSGSTIVDMGCGPGVEAMFLAAQRMRVVGVELSASALAVARKVAAIYGVKVTWVQGDILGTPIRNEFADVVNDSFVFHNIRDEARVPYAREVFRILKPAGLLVMREFSSKMVPGTGPRRLGSEEILRTFMPGFECEHLALFRNLPTETKPDQWHWLALWRRKTQLPEEWE